MAQGAPPGPGSPLRAERRRAAAYRAACTSASLTSGTGHGRPTDARAVARLRRWLGQDAPGVLHAHGLRAGALAALALAGRPGRRTALVVTVHNAAPPGQPGRRGLRGAGTDRGPPGRRRAPGVRGPGRAAAPPGRPDRRAGRDRRPGHSGARPGASRGGAPGTRRGRPAGGAGGRPAGRAERLRHAARRGRPLAAPRPGAAAGHRGRRAARPGAARQAAAAGTEVRFLGPRPDVPVLLAAADVVVVPSSWEGQPLIVQEALRAGRPLVASRAGGIADLTGADGALLVPPGDPEVLAAAVTRLVDDPGEAAALAARGPAPGRRAAGRGRGGGPGRGRVPALRPAGRDSRPARQTRSGPGLPHSTNFLSYIVLFRLKCLLSVCSAVFLGP